MPSSRSLLLHLVVDEEGLGDRAGVGQAGRLDEDVVEPVAPLHQVAEDADQVAADGAADAAVVHLEDFFLGVDDEVLIDADLAELVLDDGDPLAVLGGEDVVEQRRLAGPEEAGQDGDGDAVSGRTHVRGSPSSHAESQRAASSLCCEIFKEPVQRSRAKIGLGLSFGCTGGPGSLKTGKLFGSGGFHRRLTGAGVDARHTEKNLPCGTEIFGTLSELGDIFSPKHIAGPALTDLFSHIGVGVGTCKKDRGGGVGDQGALGATSDEAADEKWTAQVRRACAARNALLEVGDAVGAMSFPRRLQTMPARAVARSARSL